MNILAKFLRLPKRLQTIEKRILRLENALEFVARSPVNAWLYANREERMDANVPIYDEDRRRFHLARYELAASYVSGMSVADIACGTGYGAELLTSKNGASRVTGVDIDPEAIHYAQDRYGNESVKFICASGDATGLPVASFDAVISFETIEHVPDDQALLREFARLLKPKGRLIVSTPNDWGLTPYHVRSQDLASFQSSVTTAGFHITRVYNQNSGSGIVHNHGQPAGLVATTPDNARLAECYVAVCEKA